MTEDSAGPTKRSRASRSGRPKAFRCKYPACDKSYSRAEHRARHELNRGIYYASLAGERYADVDKTTLSRSSSALPLVAHEVSFEKTSTLDTKGDTGQTPPTKDDKTATGLYGRLQPT